MQRPEAITTNFINANPRVGRRRTKQGAGEIQLNWRSCENQEQLKNVNYLYELFRSTCRCITEESDT